jgi:hypothetical protein
MRGLPQLPSFHAKSQVLEIHKHKKHVKVPHNKESHKVEVLERIYFRITGQSKTRIEREREERNISCPNARHGSEDPKW